MLCICSNPMVFSASQCCLLNRTYTSACSQQNLFTICRFEYEADYIGLLLMAAAGYDPQQAPIYYEKMAKLDAPVKYPVLASFPCSHPPGRERAKAVARPEIMKEALLLYNDVRVSHWVE